MVAAGAGAQRNDGQDDVSTTVVVPARDYIIPVFEDRDRTYTTTYTTGLLKINATDYLLIDNEVLLAETPIVGSPATISLTAQPSSAQWLTITMMDTIASGTLAITGTDANGSALSESISVSVQIGAAVYTTTGMFKTVNASGIIATNLGGATIAVNAKYRLILQDTSGTSIQAPSVVVPFRDYTIPVPERLTNG